MNRLPRLKTGRAAGAQYAAAENGEMLGMGKNLAVRAGPGRRKYGREGLTGFLFTLPAMLGTCVFFLVPFVLNLFRSFFTTDGAFAGLGNYTALLGNKVFRLAAWNTVKFILVAVPLIMLFSLFVALLLNRKLKGSSFFRAVFVFPLVLPVASVILFFDILFTETGVMNHVLAFFHIPVVNWLNSSASFPVLVFLYIWKNCGYDIILFLASFNSIPREYYEVFRLESTNVWERLRYVTLPMIVPHLFFIFVISVTNSLKAFREAYILCGDYPDNSIYMLQHYINNNFQTLNYSRLSVATILIFLFVFLLVYLAFWLKRKAWYKE